MFTDFVSAKVERNFSALDMDRSSLTVQEFGSLLWASGNWLPVLQAQQGRA
jgi:hypothetical protein